MSNMASQITGISNVRSTVCSVMQTSLPCPWCHDVIMWKIDFSIWFLHQASLSRYQQKVIQSLPYIFRDHIVYAPSQWETTLQCNVVSHWLGAYAKWSLHLTVVGGSWEADTDLRWQATGSVTRHLCLPFPVLSQLMRYHTTGDTRQSVTGGRHNRCRERRNGLRRLSWVQKCHRNSPLSASKSYRPTSSRSHKIWIKIFPTLWNLTGPSAALLRKFMSNFKTMRKFRLMIRYIAVHYIILHTR